MEQPLYVYNTLSGKKEIFRPLHFPKVGMYVCGPTVYGDPHLGHARSAITFDVLFRYLKYIGYDVRYVRNITDVGHLVSDADDGEDKIARKAKLEQLEPMEVAQLYTNSYHKRMDELNVLSPSIEPHASGHIIEQITLTEEILAAGYAYESNGSVYFDVEKYNRNHNYGILSGRKLEDMLCATRELDGQEEKRNPADFALWKKAGTEHIMRWPSPWGEGFPGWHCECTAMGRKYLGAQFDIHGGGLDLIFPHHECEIAQAVASQETEPVSFWMHNNMVTKDGQKMGKSLGNAISLEQFFKGDHPMLEKPYPPMTIRFFMLQAHYRSLADFSIAALQASEKALSRLTDAWEIIRMLKPAEESSVDISGLRAKCVDAMNDDLNTPVLIASLFDAAHIANAIKDGKASLNTEDTKELQDIFHTYFHEILGIREDAANAAPQTDAFAKAVDLLLDIRQQAKGNKDWATSDRIRNELNAIGFEIKDTKDGAEWKLS